MKYMLRTIKIIFIVLMISISLLFLPKETKAGSNANVSGWAWSENIGWISFNSTNCDSDGDGITDTGNYSQCPTGESIGDYGVHIAPDGVFSGYAWSENIGWISFNEEDLSGCPQEPCKAEINLTSGEVSGWARALAPVGDPEGGGWDGWIHLRGTNYGVKLNPSTREFEGWAWGGDDASSTAVIGWISFNHLNCDSDNNGVSDQGNYSQCPIGKPVSDYKVETSFNLPPTAGNLSETINPCAWGTFPQVALGLSIILNWDYSDPNKDPQAAYEIWVDDDPSFSGSKFNHIAPSTAPSDSTVSYALDLSQDEEGDWLANLDWGTTYYWKVRVKDSSGSWSEFSSTSSFTTPAHAYPYPDFQPFPQNPSIGEVVEFIQDDPSVAQAICYLDQNDTATSCEALPGTNYAWDFSYDPAEGFQTDSTYKGNATTTYDVVKPSTVRLQITDDLGTCSMDRKINITLPLPKWREISP